MFDNGDTIFSGLQALIVGHRVVLGETLVEVNQRGLRDRMCHDKSVFVFWHRGIQLVRRNQG